jgi:hypothetical protein
VPGIVAGQTIRIKTGRNPTLIKLRRPISRSRLRLQLRCLKPQLRHAVIAQTRDRHTLADNDRFIATLRTPFGKSLLASLLRS